MLALDYEGAADMESVNTMGLESDAASTFSRILKRIGDFALTLAQRIIFVSFSFASLSEGAEDFSSY